MGSVKWRTIRSGVFCSTAPSEGSVVISEDGQRLPGTERHARGHQ